MNLVRRAEAESEQNVGTTRRQGSTRSKGGHRLRGGARHDRHGPWHTWEPGAGAACVRDQTSGTQELSIDVDGVSREYLLGMPDGLDPSEAAPLVVDLHGFSSNAQQQSMLSGMGDAAGEPGYVVVTPQALEVDVPLTTGSLRTTFWNIDPAAVRPGFGPADDLGFIDALLDEVIEQQCIDPDRLFVTGMSNGAGMTMALTCGSTTRFAAAAPVAGVNLVGSCEPARSIPLHAIHGDADPLIPAAGGQVVGQDYEVVAVHDRMQDLADRANCTGPTSATPFADIEVRIWADCDDDAEFVLTTVLGGGHTWPGSDLVEDLGQPDAEPPPRPEGQPRVRPSSSTVSTSLP